MQIYFHVGTLTCKYYDTLVTISEQSVELVLAFHRVGSGNLTQVIGLGKQVPLLLRHLTGALNKYLWKQQLN